MVENRNFAVGLFVTTALVLLIGFTVWITGKKGDEPVTDYSILFEKDVTGLMLGGPVFFLGVNIGQVQEMTIVPGNPVNIRVDIEVLTSTPIDQRTWATLAPQGITGVSIINLASDPCEQEPCLREPLPPAVGDSFPLIPQRDTGLTAIMSSAPAILEKMETLLDRAANMLDETNHQLVQDSLRNVEALTSSLAGQEELIAALPGQLDATLGSVSELIAELNVLAAESRPDIEAALHNLQEASGNLVVITDQFEGWAVNSDSEMQDFMANGLGQLPALIEDVRYTLREMQKLMGSLRADPDRLIYKTEQDAISAQDE